MSPFRFGVATRDITPTRPAWLDGYNARPHPIGGVKERLQLGCLAVANGRKTILIVCCDLLGIEVPLTRELHTLLKQEVGIGYPDILLASSHTHFAPIVSTNGFAGAPGFFVEPDPAYMADLRAKLVEAARESLRALRPGRLETARLAAPQVHYNRRTRKRTDGRVVTNFLFPKDPENWELRPVDSEVSVLRFRDSSGVGAILVNFGCHPVTGWGIPGVSPDLVSADYPHYLRETLTTRFGCPVLFSLGSAGDVVPMDRSGDCRERIGNVLGNTVVLGERCFQPDESARIATAALTVPAATHTRRNPAQMERAFARLMAEYGPRIVDASDAKGNKVYGSRAWDEPQLVLDHVLQTRLYPANRLQVPLQFLRIGSTVLTVLPFEVLSDISLTMKKRFPHSVLVSCANGYQGYLPLAHEFKRGGYEVSISASHFAPGTGDRVLAAVLRKLETF